MSDNEDESYKPYEVREGIAFLIDLSEDILKPIHELGGESQLRHIFQAIADLMSDMVISFHKNGVGVYLYHSARLSLKYPKNAGMDRVFSLNDLNSSNMKLLAQILRDDLENRQRLSDRYTPEEVRQDNLHTVLRTVLREFQARPQYNVKKLMWFTNLDKPYKDLALKDGLRTLISDFEDNGIRIVPLFLDRFENEAQTQPIRFDGLRFENIFLNTNFLQRATDKSFLADDNELPLWLSTTVSSRIKDLVASVKEVNRVQFSCDLVMSDGAGIGGNLGCSIKGYLLYNHETLKKFRHVHNENDVLRMVQNESRKVRTDNNEEIGAKQEEGLEKNEIKTLHGFAVKKNPAGDEEVILVDPEVTDYMKGFAFDHHPNKGGAETENNNDGDDAEQDILEFSKPPYLKLLCFQHMDLRVPYFNTKPALFVNADRLDGLGDGSKVGGFANSTKTFNELHSSCVRLNRYAVVFGCIKKNSYPNLYALVPSKSAKGSGPQPAKTIPDGFLLIKLPWLSEIRSLPDFMMQETDSHFYPASRDAAPPELTEIYGEILSTLGTSTYNPAAHHNPVLSYFYKVIKQEELEFDAENEDTTLMGNDWTVQAVQELRQNVENTTKLSALFQKANEYLDRIGNVVLAKRAAPLDDSGLKKPKAEALSEADVITLWKHDTWSQVTVGQLRAFAQKYLILKGATRKADITANIVNFLQSRQAQPSKIESKTE